MQSRSSLL